VTGDRLTIGVVTPRTAAGPEVELPAIMRGRLVIVVTRTGSPPEASQAPSRTAPPAHAELRASTEPAALDRAAVNFRDRTLAAVVRASTASGYVIGHREEAALVERLSQLTPSTPTHSR
jgi:maleate isomerase